MVRRPLNTLVEQGLVPSPKTSPFLHDQRQRLERAKMSDSLRAKIAHRPARSELVSKHILEDVPMGVDPSLCDVQRQAMTLLDKEHISAQFMFDVLYLHHSSRERNWPTR